MPLGRCTYSTVVYLDTEIEKKLFRKYDIMLLEFEHNIADDAHVIITVWHLLSSENRIKFLELRGAM